MAFMYMSNGRDLADGKFINNFRWVAIQNGSVEKNASAGRFLRQKREIIHKSPMIAPVRVVVSADGKRGG